MCHKDVTHLSMPKINPTINLRELRDTRQLKAWLQSGHTVELRERNRLLASIVPAEQNETKEWPDFAGRVEKLFGGRRLPGADLLIQERGRF
jgi:hypothetical protein